MNYYERHLGDYARDTGHLSLIEHGAYSLLLDRYYATESPIPASDVYKIARARSKAEKNAVDTVLLEFFTLVDEFWLNKRCDGEIAKYQSGEPDREIKKANESNRLKRHREERSLLFKRLTDAGHHAQWNIAMPELRALVQRLCNEPETPNMPLPATPPATPPVTATATPATATSPQTPDTNPSIKIKAASSSNSGSNTPEVIHSQPENPDVVETNKPPNGADPITTRSIELAVMLRKGGAALTASDPNVRKWAANGVSDAQALTALETAQQRRAEKCSSQPINSGYLDSIINNRDGPEKSRKSSAVQEARLSVAEQIMGGKRNGTQRPIREINPRPAIENHRADLPEAATGLRESDAG